MSHDVVIVGARCSGAALGALLARSGVKTLLLDADAMPSDMAMSTHYVHPPGMDVLDELGVGEAVRKVAPRTHTGHYKMERAHVVTSYPEGRDAFCVRRSTVDPLLQEAATKAGAELRDRHRVVELVKEGDRVAGVVVETPTGRETIRAGLVVGADGRSSTVAKLTGVEEYFTFPMMRAGYWYYAAEPPEWRSDPRFAGWDVYIGWQGDGLRYVFQCDGGQLLFLAAPPLEEGRKWGKDHRAKTVDYLRQDETLRPLVEATEPIGKVMGLIKATFYYRRPVGPGFALVGDAGNFKDYVTGHGMTDAYLGARRLHRAILDGTPRAYERYWRERDAETLPLYFDAIRSGEVGFNDAFAQVLFEEIGKAPHIAQRLTLVADRKVSPLEVLTPVELLKVLGAGLLRGRFDAVKPFLVTGKRMAGYGAEVERRKQMLAALG